MHILGIIVHPAGHFPFALQIPLLPSVMRGAPVAHLLVYIPELPCLWGQVERRQRKVPAGHLQGRGKASLRIYFPDLLPADSFHLLRPYLAPEGSPLPHCALWSPVMLSLPSLSFFLPNTPALGVFAAPGASSNPSFVPPATSLFAFNPPTALQTIPLLSSPHLPVPSAPSLPAKILTDRCPH